MIVIQPLAAHPAYQLGSGLEVVPVEAVESPHGMRIALEMQAELWKSGELSG